MLSEKIYDIAIIGGGIVGLATAYKLQEKFNSLKLVVIEKEDRLAFHQTGHNSGVIHSGLYYKPGSYRAKNCVEGRKQIVDFAQQHGIKHDVCGKIVVATDDSEFPRLEKIRNNGNANGLKGVEIIGPEKIKEIEPYIEGKKALWVPEAGIINFGAVTNKLAELIKGINPSSDILTSCELKSFE